MFSLDDGDMLEHPYFVFVVHIPFFFLFFKDYLGCYWSWTTMMNEEHLILIAIGNVPMNRTPNNTYLLKLGA